MDAIITIKEFIRLLYVLKKFDTCYKDARSKVTHQKRDRHIMIFELN